jgi:large subunit ribosomal protein L7A
MSLEEIKKAKIFVVGMRQTLKALNNDSALEVYIARDAEERITFPVIQLCEEKEIKLHYVDTMAELGKACKIKVGSAMAAIIKK